MNKISLKRIRLLLLADWYELKEYFLLMILFITGFLLVLIFTTELNMERVESYVELFSFTLLIPFFLGMSFVNYRVNSVKGPGMLIPARPVEKFISLFIVQIILLAVFFACYYITAGLYSLIKLGEFSSLINEPVISLIRIEAKLFWALVLLIVPVYWLCMLTFKKAAAMKGIIVLAVFIVAISYVKPDIIRYFMGFNDVFFYMDKGIYYDYENIYPGMLKVVPYTPYLLMVYVVHMIYIGYCKLKEKEQR